MIASQFIEMLAMVFVLALALGVLTWSWVVGLDVLLLFEGIILIAWFRCWCIDKRAAKLEAAAKRTRRFRKALRPLEEELRQFRDGPPGADN